MDLYRRILAIISPRETMQVRHEDYGVFCRRELSHPPGVLREAEAIWADLQKVRGLCQKVCEQASRHGVRAQLEMADLAADVAYEAGAGASCLICGRPDSKITDGSDATNRLDSVNKLKKPI